MAGIYIHIPFCRKACHYCDFHFSTQLKSMDQMVNAINKELFIRKEFIKEPVETIYFGGGTPSLLEESDLHSILESINTHYSIDNMVELTLEANPEDLSKEKLADLKRIGINRLSIGAQTFDDSMLNWMNRIHSSEETKTAVLAAQDEGFTNISVDLMYALPSSKKGLLISDINKAVQLSPQHISIYGLTIESDTVFGRMEAKGALKQVPDEHAAKEYLTIIHQLEQNGYSQYEVSNFCISGYESRHNNSYWNSKVYLGVGPGAHSFDGEERYFNMRNNAHYIRLLSNDELAYEKETLSEVQCINERIMTRLRTREGIDLRNLKNRFSLDLVKLHSKFIDQLITSDMVYLTDDRLSLKPKGFLVADEIALRLFLQEND